MISPELKRALIRKYGAHENDTGRPEVQIAIFTHRVHALTKHLERHPKDFSTRRGLLKLVGKRRRLLDYLMREDITRYRAIIQELGIRK